VSENLISLYSLDRIASTVARKDPVTGEKINKLRKSYEGKLKNLGLPGRNKPSTAPGELLGFMEWPDEGWYDQRVYGKELERAPNNGAVVQKLDRALRFNMGQLPRDEHEKWKGTLGLEDLAPPPSRTPVLSSGSASTKTAAQAAFARSGQATSMRASAPASPRQGSSGGAGVARPDRQGKKRRYDDASFEGYSETGYADDDGYSTGGLDDRRSSASRKRRRVSSGHS